MVIPAHVLTIHTDQLVNTVIVFSNFFLVLNAKLAHFFVQTGTIFKDQLEKNPNKMEIFFKIFLKQIEEVGWPHGLKLKTLIKSLLEKIF